MEKHCSIPNQNQCKICGVSRNSRPYLRKHMERMHKVHLDGSPVPLDRKSGLTNDKPRIRVIQRYPEKPREVIAGKFKCYYCPKLFSRVSGCQRHEKERHPTIPGQFPCDICGKAWNSREYLMKHRRKTHNVGVAKRNDPFHGKVVDDSLGLTLKNEGDGDGENGCSTESVFSSPNDELGDDYRVGDEDTDSKIISTPVIKTEVEFEAYHNENVDDNDMVEREDNGLQLDDVRLPEGNQDEDEVRRKMEKAMGFALQKITTQARRHVKREKVDGKFKCSFCDKLFAKIQNCWRHEKAQHQKKEKRIGCKHCDMTFRDRYGLQRHERAAHGKGNIASASEGERQTRVSRKLEWVDGKVKCGSCDKWFKTPTALKNHERTHRFREFISKNEDGVIGLPSGQKRRKFDWVDGKLKCRYCDKLFCSKGGLLNHESRTHLNKPGDFICDMCGKGLNSLEYLTGHKRRFHKVKADGSPWVPKNGKKPGRALRAGREEYGLFSKNGKGKRGTKYLRVEGKLKCNYCERLFISADGLYKHKREKHPKTPGEFICTHCGMAFNSMDYLKKHTERKHWMKIDGSPYIPPWVPTRKFKWKKSPF